MQPSFNIFRKNEEVQLFDPAKLQWKLSDEHTWQGAKLFHHIAVPSTLCPIVYATHYLCYNLGDTISTEIYVRGRWTRQDIQPGSIKLCAAGDDQHQVRWYKSCNLFGISLDPSLLDVLLERNNASFNGRVNLHDLFLKTLAAEWYSEARNGNAASKLYGDSMAAICAIHLATTYCRGTKRVFAPKGRLSSAQAKTVVDYIATYLHTNISLQQLSDLVHQSPYHFLRTFKHTFRTTPHKYLSKLRCEKAKSMIRNGS